MSNKLCRNIGVATEALILACQHPWEAIWRKETARHQYLFGRSYELQPAWKHWRAGTGSLVTGWAAVCKRQESKKYKLRRILTEHWRIFMGPLLVQSWPCPQQSSEEETYLVSVYWTSWSKSWFHRVTQMLTPRQSSDYNGSEASATYYCKEKVPILTDVSKSVRIWKLDQIRRSKTEYEIWNLTQKILTKAKFRPLRQNWDFLGNILELSGTLSLFSWKWKKKRQ